MSLAEQLEVNEWQVLRQAIDLNGFAVIPSMFSQSTCKDLINSYTTTDKFRSKVVMNRHGFGQGEYQYFSYPLPPIIETLRETFYEQLTPLARNWNERLRLNEFFPDTLREFLDVCHLGGQTRPTPLLLKYEAGDFNRLHQDVYGAIGFPFQLAICLSEPGRDFLGGEFVVTEQRARMQTRVEVVPLGHGDAVAFANRYRPVSSARGYSRAVFRHGVSKLHHGTRYCLGVIFHDAA